MGISPVRYVSEQLHVRELREIARGGKIKGIWSMHRADLIESLQKVDELDEVYSMAVMFRQDPRYALRQNCDVP